MSLAVMSIFGGKDFHLFAWQPGAPVRQWTIPECISDCL